MKKTLLLSASILSSVLAVISLGYTSQTTAQESDEQLLERHVTLPELAHLTTAGTVVQGLNTAGVPGGIINVPDCEVPVRATFTPQGSTLRSVLDSVVSSDSQYQWEINRGVVNLLPRSGEPSFLKLRVRQFKAEQVGTVYEALDQLLATPELKKGMEDSNLGSMVLRGGMGYYGQSKGRQQKFTISVENTTVREALNAIARAQGTAVWAYTQHQCKGTKSFSIDFLVR
jgi:hypothetical protein